MKRIIVFGLLMIGALHADAQTIGDVLWKSGSGKPGYSHLSSTYLIEGTNLFFTTARARAGLSATLPLAYDPVNGIYSFTGLSGLGGPNKIMKMNAAGTAAVYATFAGVGGATITYSSGGDTIYLNAGSGGGGGSITGIQNTDGYLTVTNPSGPTTTVNLHTGTIDSVAAKTKGLSGTNMADSTIKSRQIAGGTIVRANVSTTFKAPGADTADFARAISQVDSNATKSKGLSGTNLADSTIKSRQIAGGTIVRANVSTTFKAPYADTSDAAKGAPPIGPAAGGLTGNYPNPTLATGSVTTGSILDGTIQRADVATNFKAPFADTADAARSAPDSTFQLLLPMRGDTVRFTDARIKATSKFTVGWQITLQTSTARYPAGTPWIKSIQNGWLLVNSTVSGEQDSLGVVINGK